MTIAASNHCGTSFVSLPLPKSTLMLTTSLSYVLAS
uniref:Uncharacterized protein n=1 Tax=Arundo donax TaxID=35708 RepID=A0A0A9HT39_ARUDO